MHEEGTEVVVPENRTSAVGDRTELLLHELRDVWRRSAVATLVAVGDVIIRHCYGGDVEAWRQRGKNAPLRELENHPRLPFPRKTVYLALHFHDLNLRVAGSPFLFDLGVGHVRTVLGLPPPEQERLLRCAHSENWTIAELTKHAASARDRAGRKSGRPPAPEGARTLRQLRRRLDEVESMLVQMIDAGTCGKKEIAVALLDTVGHFRNEMDRAAAPPRLCELLDAFPTGNPPPPSGPPAVVTIGLRSDTVTQAFMTRQGADTGEDGSGRERPRTFLNSRAREHAGAALCCSPSWKLR
jgi:hypothetical protein